jgi:hypothetical protein
MPDRRRRVAVLGPLVGEHAEDEGIGPLPLDEFVFTQVGFLAHADPRHDRG